MVNMSKNPGLVGAREVAQEKLKSLSNLNISSENKIISIKTKTVEEIKYNSWPLGKLPVKFQRPELQQIKELGYHWDDPRDVITIFEEKVAKFAGSKYAVATDCCTNGLFLSLKYLQHLLKFIPDAKNRWYMGILIPKNTYVSLPMQIRHAGYNVEFEEIKWSGIYQLKYIFGDHIYQKFPPFSVWDGAVRWTKDMYVGNNALQVVSFQTKKRVPIGRGGMILTDDLEARNWLKKMTYDGRDLSISYDKDPFEYCGYHMYMTPEDAARGIILMEQVPEINEDSGDWTKYPDISKARFLDGS